MNKPKVEKRKQKSINIQVVKGVEGICLYVTGVRMAGPKPWGGGKVLHSFDVNATELMDRLCEVEQEADHA